jgi:hypothetical protein
MSAIFCDKKHVDELKKSMDLVGPLQPLVVDDKTGELLLGKHRKNTGHSEIPETKIHVKDALHRELILVHGNKQRQPDPEETKYHIVRIAKMLEEEGVPEDLKQVLNPQNDPSIARMLDGKIPQERICAVVCSLVPYDETYVRRLLPKEYKMMVFARDEPGREKIGETSPADTPEAPADLAETLTSLATENEKIETKYPFKDCRCSGCPNKIKCYG